VAFWLGWWLGFFWLWILISGDWNKIEILAAAGASTLAASVAEVMRTQTDVAPRIPLRQVARAWTVPHQIVVDFWIVTLALFRRQEGVFREHELPANDGPGTRAWLAWTANFSPNAYVVDIDPERGSALFHDLVPNRASEEPA
jgi:hypothetical protein